MANKSISQCRTNGLYSPFVSKTFSEWLQGQLNERGWTGYDLAKEMRSAPATVYRLLNGERNAGRKLAPKIAKALKIQSDVVLYHAGYSDRNPTNPLDPVALEILSLLENKSEAQKRAVLATIEALFESLEGHGHPDENRAVTTRKK